jgi:formamidopyrimidine-DNA glycosylase
LEQETPGRRIVDVLIANTKILKGQSPEEFRKRILETRIRRVDRRGKFLLFSLIPDEATNENNPQHNSVDSGASPLVLCVHLKMRGQLLLEPVTATPGPYHCVSLRLSAPNEERSEEEQRVLRFYDMWTWGEMRALTEDECRLLPGLAGMGPEPLADGWNGAALRAGLGNRRTAIKTSLLDQKVVAGVGNIYADESLFRSGINPKRPAVSLTVGETDRLATEIRAVLSDAIRGGGTQSEEYVDLAGAVGRYRPQVYDRGGEACEKCGLPLTKIRLGGRGTVFCPDCQS